ncbi:MAG: substrate-binding domain-containing protein [Candidatus Lustribacter sp.]
MCLLAFSPLTAFAQTKVAAADTRVASLGVSVVADPNAGVSSLTRDQVGSIFSGSVTNWSQLGGASLPITVITRGDSAVQTAFDKVYLAGSNPTSGTVLAGTADALAKVASTPGAVTFAYDEDAATAAGVDIITVSDIRKTDVTGLIDLGTVGTTTANGTYQTIGGVSSVVSPIAATAPTQMDTDSMETHSLITRDFIDENSSPLSEYTRIATIAPSVSNTGAVNGPGLSEQKLVIRGMGSDFTNVTFDGIPESDTNDPSYHSTSFFPELIVGGVDLVRGPGYASDMGYATFGGSENVYSLAASEKPSLTTAFSAGTWNTYIGSATYQSGRQAWLGNGKLVATFQDLGSQGYLTGNNIWSRNYSFKYEVPFGQRTLFDAFASWNDQAFNAADAGPGATLYELTTYGQNYSLNNNPASGECQCYNFQIKTTDIGYLRLRSDLGWGFHLDNKLYTYRYDNETTAADSVGVTSTMAAAGTYPSQGTITCTIGSNACTAPLVPGSLAANNLKYNPTDIGGYLKRNKYIAAGDILEVTKNLTSNDFIRAGVWLEHSDTDRHQYSIDMTNGLYNYVDGSGCLYGTADEGGAISGSGAPTVVAPNCAASATSLPAGLKQLPGPSNGLLYNGVPIGAVKFDQQSQILNAQPFVEAQFVIPGSGTTIYPGFKELVIQRYDIAAIQNTSRTPDVTDKILYTSQLPFLSINQPITTNAAANAYSSFYFQYARGYEIPNLTTFYVNNPLQNATTPNETSTYQAGFIGRSNDLIWDVDYYTINFSDLQSLLSVDANGNPNSAGPYSAYFDVGGAKYQGIETEATFSLGGGAALYANYSTDEAKELTYNSQVANVPLWTGALGVLYKSPHFDTSLIYKLVGQQYLNAYTPANAANYNDPNQQVPAYGLLDFDFTWKAGHELLQLNVYNLTNSQPILTAVQTSLTSSGLMTHIAPSSFLLTLKHKI